MLFPIKYIWKKFTPALSVSVRRLALSRSYSSSSYSTQSAPKAITTDEKEVQHTQMPNPLQHHDFFEVRNIFTVKDLLDARVHYGHTMGTLNEHMKQFVLGSRLGTLIIDLDQTAELLSDALNFTAHMAFRGGIIMFATRSKQNGNCVEKTALECGEYAHTRHFQHGDFTDPNRFGSSTRLPDLVIFLNTLDNVFEQHRAITECSRVLIPTVGIVDTNCFPNFITYPVPGNDDTPSSVELFCKLFKTAVLKGKAKRKEFIQKYGDTFHNV